MPPMPKDEKQEFIDKMYRDRGYILDFHKIMVAEDFEWLKAYNGLIEAAYTDKRSLDAKTKEIIYTVVLTALRGSVDHIKAHMQLALDYGATRQELLEALQITMLPAGVPAYMQGIEAWKQVASPKRIEPSVPKKSSGGRT